MGFIVDKKCGGETWPNRTTHLRQPQHRAEETTRAGSLGWCTKEMGMEAAQSSALGFKGQSGLCSAWGSRVKTQVSTS